MGAELGSCCHSAWAILIGILQNRQEMQFSAKDRRHKVGVVHAATHARPPRRARGRTVEGLDGPPRLNQ